MVSTKIKGNVIFESTPNFFCHLPEETQKKMQATWTDALNTSKFILAPRGCGLNSIRFFEALSFGRIPILIADDTKLPLEEKIDYSEFVIRVPESEMDTIPQLIEEFKEKNDLVIASRLALTTWEENFSGGRLRRYLENVLPKVSRVKKSKLLV